MKREFNKYCISDYTFYVGRNKGDYKLGFKRDKEDPKLLDNTNKKLIGNVFLPRQVTIGSIKEEVSVVNVFELNGVLNGNLYRLHKITDREKFDYELRGGLMNQLGSRCQYEIGLCELFTLENYVKTDVYTQIMINGFHFEKYCWEHKKLFKKFKSSYNMIEKNNKYGRSKK